MNRAAARKTLMAAAVLLALALLFVAPGAVLPVVLALLTAGVVVLAAAAPWPAAGEGFAPGGDKTIALFKASWCKYCKLLAPTWTAFEAAAKTAGIPTRVYDVDAPADKPAFTQYGVTSFPTILALATGSGAKLQTYEGKRTVGDLLAWAAGPP
jgi:thiol-disulfide isomerase/thioredoxin